MTQNQAQYTVKITPTNATNKEITWSIENQTGEATIDVNGLVTALAPGTIKIIATATDGTGIIGTKIVTITQEPILVEEIEVEGLSEIPFVEPDEED